MQFVVNTTNFIQARTEVLPGFVMWSSPG